MVIDKVTLFLCFWAMFLGFKPTEKASSSLKALSIL